LANIYDAIIFDFDGTLFQTEKLAIPSFKQTFEQLQEEGYDIKVPSESDMLSVIGMTLEEIWNKLLPHLSTEVHEMANRYMLYNEIKGVKEKVGALYPGVVDTLNDLKNNGYRLFIASNGLKEYIKAVSEAFRIAEYFEAIYTAGEFHTETKIELAKRLIKDYSIKKAIMVGDRKSDVDAGRANQLYVVGCNFGFSSLDELNDADIMIEHFSQLNKIVHQLSG